MQTETYNLAVLGAGSGGLVCAAGASGLGAKVVLIEKHKMGGDCLNTGCVPSKALIKSAKVASFIKHAERYGIKVSDYEVDFREVMERVQRVIGRIEPHDSPERFRGLGVNVQFGAGRFVSPNEVTNGEKTFRAKKIVIATGSRPAIPPIKGLEQANVLTSENVWDIRELPKKLAVVGGGPIGCELAQCFARFGSEVSVIIRRDRILPRDDEAASKLVMDVFKEDGIDIRLNSNTKEVVKRDGKTFLILETNEGDKELEFDAILIAAGRTPNIDSLDLDKVGVETTKRGVKVNGALQTSRSHIYACGDVAGPYLFTHTADYQARMILRNAFFPGSKKVNYRVVPWCTYTDPEVAQVGLTAAEAEHKGIAHDVTNYSLNDLDRAICDGSDRGFVKVVTEKGKDTILGATLVGEHAGDLLHEIVVAMQHNIGLKQIASTIHAYPTLAEGPKRTADAWMRGLLTPTTKKFLSRYFAWQR